MSESRRKLDEVALVIILTLTTHRIASALQDGSRHLLNDRDPLRLDAAVGPQPEEVDAARQVLNLKLLFRSHLIWDEAAVHGDTKIAYLISFEEGLSHLLKRLKL